MRPRGHTDVEGRRAWASQDGHAVELAAMVTEGPSESWPMAGTAARRTPAARRWHRLRHAALLALPLAVMGGAWATVTRASYFRLRAIEVRGTHFLDPATVVTAAAVDTSASIVRPTDDVVRRVRALPLVRDARVDRRWPGTFIVTITEEVPVAYLPGAVGLVPVDRRGRIMPIAPMRHGADRALDLPLVSAGARAAVPVLAALQDSAPALYQRIVAVRAQPLGRSVPGAKESVDLVAELSGAERVVHLRLWPTTPLARLLDLSVAEQALRQRSIVPDEFDVRFAGQVVVRY